MVSLQSNWLFSESRMMLSPSTSDPRVPSSLSYHVADIYLTELDKTLGLSASVPPAPLAILLDPFITLAARTHTSTTYQRIQSVLFLPLLNALDPDSCKMDESPKSKRIRLATDDTIYPNLLTNACFDGSEQGRHFEGQILKSKLLQRIFEVASQPETRDSNRRKMYALWKEHYEESPNSEQCSQP